MSDLYPGIKAVMGEEDSQIVYYMVKMKAKDLAMKMVTNKEVDKDQSKLVDKMVQRAIRANRATGAIAQYLTNAHENGERFMGSFVVATFGGSPKWIEVPLDKTAPEYEFFSSDIGDFGLLKFDGEQQYFVLDGQHRLTGLRYIFGQDPELAKGKKTVKPPPNLANDELSVLVISDEDPSKEKKKNMDEASFRRRLRRIFTVLNRHAKQTTLVENISMDEDDIAAIHTRRLLNDIEIFQWSGKKEDTPVVDTEKAQLKEGTSHLTTIATVYEINKIFIRAIYDKNDSFFDFAPSEDIVDSYYETVLGIWNLLIKTIDGWSDGDRGKMRNHTPPEERGNDGSMDHLLFWPVGQIGLANYIVSVIEKEMKENTKYDIGMVKKALKNINKINWDLFAGPWFGYTLHKVSKSDKQNRVGRFKTDPEVVYKMFGAGGSASYIADMISFLKGEFATESKQTELFRDEWEGKLRIYGNTPELVDKYWKETIAMRKKIAGS